ncbi:hypothetical protein EMCRGX_G020045 [Ephydatia muelleri]
MVSRCRSDSRQGLRNIKRQKVSTSSRTKYTQSSHICFSLLDNDAAYILEITRDFWILEICLDFKCSK